jgi:hypothetical protein
LPSASSGQRSDEVDFGTSPIYHPSYYPVSIGQYFPRFSFPSAGKLVVVFAVEVVVFRDIYGFYNDARDLSLFSRD